MNKLRTDHKLILLFPFLFIFLLFSCASGTNVKFSEIPEPVIVDLWHEEVIKIGPAKDTDLQPITRLLNKYNLKIDQTKTSVRLYIPEETLKEIAIEIDQKNQTICSVRKFYDRQTVSFEKMSDTFAAKYGSPHEILSPNMGTTHLWHFNNKRYTITLTESNINGKIAESYNDNIALAKLLKQ